MKRFYERVETTKGSKGWVILLDEKALKTPLKHPLELPTKVLAKAILVEWVKQESEIDPLSMPLTRLANSTIDRTQIMRREAINEVINYAKSDALCYQVGQPKDLSERQETEWRPLLEWLDAKWGVRLFITEGIIQVKQETKTLEKIESIVSSFNDFELTSLHALTISCGSIVIAFALIGGQIDTDRALRCATLEELYQMDLWGVDPETLRRHKELNQDINTAYQFYTLASGTDSL
tara:strand:- start:542 stop:1249 length:708 start_codon:yes stop_codon:yes gene_type:complete